MLRDHKNLLIVAPQTSRVPDGVPLGYPWGASGSKQNLVKSKNVTNRNFYICISDNKNHLIVTH